MDRLMVSVSGVRGTIGGTLTPQVACDFGCAFATMLSADKTVVVGSDTRPSGPMIRRAVTAGLVAGGVHVVDLGVVTTPGVALMTRLLQADGGVIITASHNPKVYNGIKFLQPSGVGLTARQAGQLKQIWQEGSWSLVDVDRLGRCTSDTSTHERHIEATLGIVDPDAISKRGFKVVLDSINGAGCIATPQLLSRLGCEVYHLNASPSGQFAHQPEPIKENLAQLCEAVRSHRADVGFAQDPDADRLVIVDENGTFIGEEYTLALTAAYRLSHTQGKLATNLATSRMIDDIAASRNCAVVRTPTGEANVVEGMEREGCFFGGEGNGGVIDPRVVPVRDSLVGIAMMLQYLTETRKTVGELAGEIPRYRLIKTKLPCPAGAAQHVARRTREAFEQVSGARFNDADGLRIDLPDAWLCVRASNTEPIMRIFAEAPEKAQALELVEKVRRIADEVVSETS
jgi:phosphomannomutase